MTDPERTVPLPKDDRNRAARRLVGVALLAMLLVGVLLGILVDRFVPMMHGKSRWARGGPPPGMMNGQPPRRVGDALAHDLGLTPVQRANLDSIMARHIRQFEAVHADTRPRIQQIMTSMRAEMDSVLTPEQRTRMHERFARARRWRPDSGGGSGAFGPRDGPPMSPNGPPRNLDSNGKHYDTRVMAIGGHHARVALQVRVRTVLRGWPYTHLLFADERMLTAVATQLGNSLIRSQL